MKTIAITVCEDADVLWAAEMRKFVWLSTVV